MSWMCKIFGHKYIFKIFHQTGVRYKRHIGFTYDFTTEHPVGWTETRISDYCLRCDHPKPELCGKNKAFVESNNNRV